MQRWMNAAFATLLMACGGQVSNASGGAAGSTSGGSGASGSGTGGGSGSGSGGIGGVAGDDASDGSGGADRPADGSTDAGDGSTDPGANWRFSEAKKHPLRTYAEAIAVADVTGDGKDDAVIVATREIYVFVQTADGQLANVQTVAHEDWGDAGAPPTFPAALVRLGPEPLPDLIIGYRDGYGIFRNDGTGRFAAEVRKAGPPSRALLFRPFDLDRDNQPDIVANGADGFLLAAHYGDGRGGIRESRQLIPSHPQAIPLAFAFSDVFGTGMRDAVIGVFQGGAARIEIFPGDGSPFGPSSASLDLVGSWGGLNGVDAGDFNGDGLIDLVAVQHANSPRSYIAVLYQQQPRVFAKQETITSYDFAESPHAIDIDGNGQTDIIVMHGGFSSCGVYLQKGGVLQPERRFTIPQANTYNANSSAIGDLDSDGCKDLALADSDTINGLVVLYGRDCAR